MPSLRVDPTSAVPVFRQIAEGMRSLIAAGVYRAGERVPSVRQQAVTLVVNPNTVQRAYEELERAGLLESQKGIGMVVRDGSRPAATRGAAGVVETLLADAVTQAHAAGLSRKLVDSYYKTAWANTRADVAEEIP